MRYNQESLRLASRQSVANKEGKLRHKAPKENSYRDRAVRLKGNFLFYFKLDDTKTRIEREPHGWILLENISVKIETYADEQFVFSLECGNDKHFFSAPFQEMCNDWVAAIQQASYTHLQTQIRSLCRVIEQRTRRDPMSDIVERIAARDRQGVRPVQARTPAPVAASRPAVQTSTVQPTCKAPPPPTAASQQATKWFTDLQTLDPQAFLEPGSQNRQRPPSFETVPSHQPLSHTSQHGPVVKRPQVNSAQHNTLWHVPPQANALPGPSSGAQPPPPVNKRHSNTSWFADLEDNFSQNAAPSPELDPFGMDTSFHKNPFQPAPVNQFQGLQLGPNSTANQQNTKGQKPLNFNWTTFD